MNNAHLRVPLALGVSLMLTLGSATALAEETSDSGEVVTLDLYNLTDVHGHIEQKVDNDVVTEAGLASVGSYLDKARAENADSSFTLLGDNIGASPFTSGILRDNPTVESLNLLEPVASTLGNHELDLGQEAFKQRVDGSNPAEFSQFGFPYLAANVEGMGTWADGDYLGDYKLWTAPDSGVKVAFIGGIAEDVPFKLSPGATDGLTFNDPVAKANELAQKLKESGAADIAIAMIDDDTKNNFPKMGSAIDGLMGGDTHVPYTFDSVDDTGLVNNNNAKLAGIASGSYTDNLGLLQFKYNTTTKEVVSADAQLIDAPTVAQAGEDAEISAIVDKAVTDAAVEGQKPVADGFENQRFSRGVFQAAEGQAAAPGSNRGIESSLGDLIADSFKDQITDESGTPVDIGLINAGGIREDLDAGADGVVTYADTYATMPFSNEVGYVTISGAEFKKALEQQWKTDLNSQNSRPMLKLGTSRNVRYTYDPMRDYGERITSVTINDQPLDLDATYTVGSVTFLLDGGDSFDALTTGGTATTFGNLDRNVFNDYLKANSGVQPRELKASIGVTVPTETVKDGEDVTLALRGLSFSEGPSITEKVRVSVGGETITAEVNNSLVEPNANNAASIITTDGAGTAEITVPVKASECVDGISEVPVVIDTDFGTVVPDSQGVSVTVACETPGDLPTGSSVGSALGVIGALGLLVASAFLPTLTFLLDQGFIRREQLPVQIRQILDAVKVG